MLLQIGARPDLHAHPLSSMVRYPQAGKHCLDHIQLKFYNNHSSNEVSLARYNYCPYNGIGS